MASTRGWDEFIDSAQTPGRARDASNKYLSDFERWFAHGRESLAALHEQALARQLAGCPLRSLAWQLFLQVLPADSGSWALLTAEHRRVYQLAKRTYTDYTDINDTRIACAVNNPLSLDEQSPWHRLFEHTDLRRVIRQDVVRTMPEVALFRDEEVRRIMADVLFVFMQKHPEVEYVQGMHELLAPIIYVLRREYNYFCEVRASYQHSHPHMELMQILFDKNYVEHDSFYLLEKVLLMMDWTGSVNRHREYCSEQRAAVAERPFAKDRSYSSPVQWESSACNRAVKQHLHLHDYNLYLKVVELGVEPQLFGLKMFRLLFGREFHLPELCSVWDALFADSYDTNALDLVPYVFCAILIYSRNQILALDGMEALTLLMNLPPVSDISSCIAFAMHMRSPQTHRRPDGFTLGGSSPRKVSPAAIQLRRRRPAERPISDWTGREEAVPVGRPRSMTQPLSSALPGGRTLARRHRGASDRALTNGLPAPVDMQDVSALREKHAKIASFEATAYCVMESKQCETPAQWNPGFTGVRCRFERAVEEQARCVENMERLLLPDDVNVDAVREVIRVQKQLVEELRGYLRCWSTQRQERPSQQSARRGRRPSPLRSAGCGRPDWPVEEVTPAAGLPACSPLPAGVSPAYDTLAVDVANLSLSEPGES